MAIRRPNPTRSVDDYLRALPLPHRSLLGRVRKCIRAAAPGAEEVISYGMPAFRLNGRMLVYYGAFRDHCSLFGGGTQVRRKFSVELKPFLGGKGTVRFTPEHPLPLRLIQKIVRARVAENRERYSK
ncbi:MAG: DUF1801 domain-containing protein [Thermoplasmata archaeon]|nr:DUF1801 domain-containing protein [Thermoplasmata archaeon]